MKKLLLFFVCLIFLVKPVYAGVEYNLPYPGLLPDSPLYFLKVARDNITVFFLRDEKQKAFYYLFLSDKRLAAGEVLFNTGQKKLGGVTVLKAQEYYRWAADLTVKIKNQELTEKMVVAGAKHREVISLLQAKSDKTSADNLQKALLDAQNSQNRVMELLLAR